MSEYWEISGPREYLNIPTPVPYRWRAAFTFGKFPNFKTVIGWGPTEQAARRAAHELADKENERQFLADLVLAEERDRATVR